MADINLDDLSLKELKALQSQIAKAISTFEERRKRNALSELEDKARQYGFTLAELTGTTVPRKRASPGAKFVNPDNPAETWSGRGRKPRWFENALEAGKSVDDLRV
ncbi:H-NS family nucleoid-associated regulatory protein [Cereibacter sphaeroides]|uniref:H-NS histone family protein n=1 Tax=Cereibacter sphaeroides TaxID=1063 RepID=UPI001F3ED94D|nr:H-NS histone family protein [Cereibacter sphaeroides]MCE6950670.1 H-NS histone family protein [Cereibacter sphaeroides]MCE6968344.1 H-NS histone family protein [Cereibacter sphaeroides]